MASVWKNDNDSSIVYEPNELATPTETNISSSSSVIQYDTLSMTSAVQFDTPSMTSPASLSESKNETTTMTAVETDIQKTALVSKTESPVLSSQAPGHEEVKTIDKSTVSAVSSSTPLPPPPSVSKDRASTSTSASSTSTSTTRRYRSSPKKGPTVKRRTYKSKSSLAEGAVGSPCGTCDNCMKTEDCEVCAGCLSMKEEGTTESKLSKCLNRICSQTIHKKNNQNTKSGAASSKKHTKTSTNTNNKKRQSSRRQSSTGNTSSNKHTNTFSGNDNQIKYKGSVPTKPPEKFYKDLPFPIPRSLLEVPSIETRRTERRNLLQRPKTIVALTGEEVPESDVSIPTEICGLPVPTKKFRVCGECGSNQSESGNLILLCDGEGCGQEFHMKCCTPQIQHIHKGKFYCFDCSKMGTTKQLEEYFQHHEERKDKHETTLINQFIPSASRKRKQTQHLDSFIDMLLQEDVAIASVETDPITGSTIKSKKPKSRSRKEETETVKVPVSEFTGIPHSHLVGKPVRLYLSNLNTYHNGRILDTRSDDESIVALIRFPAGKDQRKKALTQWMHLEEHSIAVATDIVWALIGSTKKKRSTGEGIWVPSKIWRRSARELVPVMREAEDGMIQYRALTKEPNESDKSSTQQWALIESFEGGHELVDIREDTSLDPPAGKRIHDILIEGLVSVEREAQRRVQNWHDLRLQNPYHSLKAQDIKPLEFEMPSERQVVRPTSLVDHGLDREMIMNLVADQMGTTPTKDLALGISCELTNNVSLVQSSNGYNEAIL